MRRGDGRFAVLFMVVAIGSALVGAKQVQAAQPVMRLVIMPDAIAQFAAALPPIDLSIPGNAGRPSSTVKLAALVFCGAESSGAASLLAVVQPSDEPAIHPRLSAAECVSQPAETVRRLHANFPGVRWIRVVHARLSWQPWRLRARLVDLATAGNSSSAPTDSPGSSIDLSTAGLHLLPSPGQALSFDLATAVRANYVIAALFAHPGAVDPDQFLRVDNTLEGEIASAPAGTNTLVDARDSFINRMLRIYAPVYQIPLNVQGVGQDLTARNISIAGGENALQIIGQLALSGLTYDARVDCAGGDLAIREIVLKAPDASACTSDDMIERLQCQARVAAMQGSSTALSSSLTNYYQGQKFRYSTDGHPFDLTLGDATLVASFDALKTSSNGSVIGAAGRATISRAASDR
jgi:hypothetical protein